ncbi:MAG: FtsK/SpoIIIE domain-containing protein [Thermoguttaceae bacterium]|nr:FtsK/SpoIIIE domain-containing protein [Thermoguttaceae bacterium]MDW8039031.1 FtsK/SpoIIIE domain-containing protein [Thermoguttaceae bacterium]
MNDRQEEATAPVQPGLPAESSASVEAPAGPEVLPMELLSCRAWQGWLKQLVRMNRRRAPAERRIPALATVKKQWADKRYTELRTALEQKYYADKAALQQDYQTKRQTAEAEFQTEYARLQREYEKKRRHLTELAQQQTEEIRRRLQEAQWEAQTVYDATKDRPILELQATQARIESLWQEIHALHEQAVRRLQQRWLWSRHLTKTPLEAVSKGPWAETASAADSIQQLAELGQQARQCLVKLDRFAAGRLLEGGQPVVWLLLGLVIGAVLGAALQGWHPWIAWVEGAAVGLALPVGLLAFYYPKARRQARAIYGQLRRLVDQAESARCQALQAAQAHCQQTQRAMEENLKQQLHQAKQAASQELARLQTEHQTALAQLEADYPARLQQLTDQHRQHLAHLEADFQRRSEELDQTFQAESAQLEARYQRYIQRVETWRQNRWKSLRQRWSGTIQQFSQHVQAAHQWADRLCPAWDRVDWNKWTPPSQMPPGVRFGRFRLLLEHVPGGLPQHPDLQVEQTAWAVPALVPFPDWPLLLLRVGEEGRQEAVELLQTILLRLLTTVPPAKLRLTIIDPVGLGENFSAFMHLADYDEKLVSSRIWTEPAHIDQRLVDLTQHMETVLQVYLRNEFETIVQYNAFAGELAEPYRILVIANFPAGFQEQSAARLRSIISSGARCGVFTLMSVDDRLRLPRDFHLSDLQPYAWVLQWQDGRFIWEHPEVGPLVLESEPPPPPEVFTQIVRRVGQWAQEAGKVEVPFAAGAPEPDHWWTASSQEGLEVPLGRAGAKKFQYLRLGEGTSQHVLVAGKTGSGKSTLWHVLITQTALRYSPDEVELYLVDFKKGVEFKAYAAAQLPHARVIAIESEREFGLSVLERLDGLLHERGDLFRQHGVQDLPSFRAQNPQVRLPRVLLVIDEFQELFVEDDRIAQAAALLLDRLVRQGRAFGIHVLLGSQTLAGAYSLPRSTLGQMAVRIALQCSETDAHLILSEENTAARLLTRPGEAIYNDANGLYEGNHPFQVFWLPDTEREKYLAELREFALRRQYQVPKPIVFEGNAPARLEENIELCTLLERPVSAEPPRTARIWLGEAVSIKPPTQASFVRQSSSNLLIVGHRDDLARGLFTAGLISLAAQYPPADAKGMPSVQMYLLDGTRPDAPEAEYFRQLADLLPYQVEVVGPAQAGQTIGGIAAELARRQTGSLDQEPPIYLFVYDLARFRTLRRSEDEFGFSFGGEDRSASPAQQLAQILREGPAWGIHTILWCDSYHTFTRWLDRHALPEFEMRVLFSMNASDSSNLVDSTIGASLGMQRAVLYLEAFGTWEKFRPYAPPSQDFLHWTSQQLCRRISQQL